MNLCFQLQTLFLLLYTFVSEGRCQIKLWGQDIALYDFISRPPDLLKGWKIDDFESNFALLEQTIHISDNNVYDSMPHDLRIKDSRVPGGRCVLSSVCRDAVGHYSEYLQNLLARLYHLVNRRRDLIICNHTWRSGPYNLVYHNKWQESQRTFDRYKKAFPEIINKRIRVMIKRSWVQSPLETIFLAELTEFLLAIPLKAKNATKFAACIIIHNKVLVNGRFQK